MSPFIGNQGGLASPGMRETVSVTRWSIRPAITKLWPSPSSILVSILREDSAGMVKPLKDSALAKSSDDTSGLTCMLIVLLAVMVGLKLSRTPNSRN